MRKKVRVRIKEKRKAWVKRKREEKTILMTRKRGREGVVAKLHSAGETGWRRGRTELLPEHPMVS
eukprot:1354942-Amorphochlora_amoeboformis.AAC.1